MGSGDGAIARFFGRALQAYEFYIKKEIEIQPKNRGGWVGAHPTPYAPKFTHGDVGYTPTPISSWFSSWLKYVIDIYFSFRCFDS